MIDLELDYKDKTERQRELQDLMDSVPSTQAMTVEYNVNAKLFIQSETFTGTKLVYIGNRRWRTLAESGIVLPREPEEAPPASLVPESTLGLLREAEVKLEAGAKPPTNLMKRIREHLEASG